jgi:hypothetical protein
VSNSPFYSKRDNTKRDADRQLAKSADPSHPRYSELQDSVQVCAQNWFEFSMSDFLLQLRKKTYEDQDARRMFVQLMFFATHGVDESDQWVDDQWSKLQHSDTRCVFDCDSGDD